jgi:hypothetical protein
MGGGTEYTELQPLLSGLHSVMRVKFAWLVRVGGARPPPFITFIITSKVAVYAPAEFISKKICTLWGEVSKTAAFHPVTLACKPPLLKVPQCEIFNHSDFHDFYTIKSIWNGNLVVKIKKFIQIFRGPFRAVKFLTHILSLILRSTVPSKHAEHIHQELMRTLSIHINFLHVCSA